MNRIDITDINSESLFHFIKKDCYNLIEDNGLKSYYSNNPIEMESGCLLTFANGTLGLLHMCDAWLKTIIYQVGLDNYFKSIGRLDAADYIELKENFNRLFNEGKTFSQKNMDESYTYFTNYLEDNLLLETQNDGNILLSKGIKYESSSKNKCLYDEHSNFFVTGIFKNELNEEINVVSNENNDRVFDIISKIYDMEKQDDPELKFEFLDDYINVERINRIELEMKRSI